MRRGRDVIVPDIVDGIEEVVIKHTKTRQGTIRTTEKVVPVLRPRKEHSGKSSKSKKKGKQPQREPEDAEGSGRPVPTPDDIQVHPYLEEQGYDLLDTAEDSQPQATPQATVCITFHLHGMTLLIRCRLQ